MRRREFIALLGSVVTVPLGTRAQPAKRWRVARVLVGGQEVVGHLAKIFEQRLIELRQTPGQNLAVVNRFSAPKDIEQVVRAALPDAAASETYGKRLQILAEIVPNLIRVAVLITVGDRNVAFGMASIERAAPQLGITLLPIDIRSAEDLPAAFDAMANEKAQALIVVSSALAYTLTKRTAELALEHRLPSCHPFRETVAAGGLVSLGPDVIEMARQGAAYVDKIISGASPSYLPVEQPSRYEIHLNLKTATALGLSIPPTLLGRADKVIE